MFTGIVEALGEVVEVTESGTNRSFWITSDISKELKTDQSLSHNGVCLTVEKINDDSHKVTAIRETLEKTNLSAWQPGHLVNLERCLRLNDRLDGHLVQGHVDTTATVREMTNVNGSWNFTFNYPSEFATLIIEKGSICVNGISLTLFDINSSHFSVGIIPYTYEHTNIRQLKNGDKVNLEFDVIGKYISRKLNFQTSEK